jgi:hypothetical protein
MANNPFIPITALHLAGNSKECWINMWRDRINGNLWYGRPSLTRELSERVAREELRWSDLVYRLHIIRKSCLFPG